MQTDPKEKINKSANTVGDFNTPPLRSIEPPGRHNYADNLNNAIYQMDLIAISSAHEVVDKTDDVLG